MTLDEIVPILQLAIGPVIVMSGAGLVLLSMTNRLGRVIDRARLLAESVRNGGNGESRRVRGQLPILARRAGLLRQAIGFTSFSLLLAAFLVIVLFLMALMKVEAGSVIIALFILCMLCLIAGLSFFIADINISLGALRLETDLDNRDNT